MCPPTTDAATPLHFDVTLPDWTVRELTKLPTHFPTVEARMAEVIRFSRLNVEHRTGGPFAAGVFERDSGRMIVIGVNRVMVSGITSAHAEVVTLSLAQKLIGTWDLGGGGRPAYQLVVNWRPCVMCYGATLWSGIRSLAIAGSGAELEAITGFDEGPITPVWQEELRSRGVELINNVLHAEAVKVFEAYRDSGQTVYNASRG